MRGCRELVNATASFYHRILKKQFTDEKNMVHLLLAKTNFYKSRIVRCCYAIESGRIS